MDTKLQTILEENPVLAYADKTAKEFIADRETQEYVWARIKADWKYNAAIEEAREEGIEQNARDNAKAMKAKGLESSLIAEITGLTAKQIAEL